MKEIREKLKKPEYSEEIMQNVVKGDVGNARALLFKYLRKRDAEKLFPML